MVAFPVVGDWWLDVEIIRDSGVARLRFPVKVQANI